MAAHLREALLQQFLRGAFLECSAVEWALRRFDPSTLVLVAEVCDPTTAILANDCHALLRKLPLRTRCSRESKTAVFDAAPGRIMHRFTRTKIAHSV
ncbi:hypothetical protein [Povalibacter uvarum]|uniref:hypothetical protein n=1 Tax=Povalibacter uvarum TaxID=732238 RepID=UPI001610547E|nr:hypothetical protein [Povalibacter uvarum]